MSRKKQEPTTVIRIPVGIKSDVEKLRYEYKLKQQLTPPPVINTADEPPVVGTYKKMSCNL